MAKGGTTSIGARLAATKEACAGHFGETATKACQASGRGALMWQ
ncbi:hypothetical protein ES332_D10G246700v1 [Gossypium tomentosum]|uniref:Uncharacterized protein n=1 Tax=Gossypium tomentosum TaxID=34277 RepID=A0A5D2J809_GOSTO|nr:hypothetical protein ES332_D10G246700v1 [Gossypium tomentosum]